MESLEIVGKEVLRKDAKAKVSGAAKYTNDFSSAGLLHAKMVTSPYAHARIISIDIANALRSPGVRAVITGRYFRCLTGSVIEDKPVIAIDKVRYHGEPVAVVVADSKFEAERAAVLVEVKYKPLPVVNSPGEALLKNSPLVHENLKEYNLLGEAYPKVGTNIANRTKIRKGNIEKGWATSDVIVEEHFSFPQSDHAAMETRCCIAEIMPDGQVVIYTSSQSPFEIKKLISIYFNIEPGKIIVNVPLVGGAYGGKTPVQLELIAYLASSAVGGRKVKLANSREEDMITSPVHIGLDAKVKLGCKSNGKLTAAEILFLFDGGAYSDRAVIISRAAAVDCTGPYSIENVWCDSLCMYTNHPYATAFRGFGHSELTFTVERIMDILAERLGMDPLNLRLKNAIYYGDTTPTRVVIDPSNAGNLPLCIKRLSELMCLDKGNRVIIDGQKVRAKGVSCIWKTSNTPTDAGAGAIITFNPGGSINLNCGAVEIGQSSKTVLAQILAERMKMDIDMVHVFMGVNTQITPHHWKTAASSSTLMVGRAVLKAADDAIRQLICIASEVLRCPKEDLDLGWGRVFLRDKPAVYVSIEDLAFGFTYPDGNTAGSQVIGRGSYVFRRLTNLDPETGMGNPGPEWTVGAQAVEVEFDTRDFTYKILKAATVIDAGKVINPCSTIGQIMGGMALGLSFASRESFMFKDDGTIRNPTLRTYKIMRFGENPEYLVDFVETPKLDAPYGARGIGEYGVIGMPAALANSLSIAAGIHLNNLPLVPELIWSVKREVTSS